MNSGRYVILLHESHRDDHWDFMLENGDILTTWAMTPQLSTDSFTCHVESLPDHRRAYLEYEGPVSHNRGTVRRIDEGIFEIMTPNSYRLTGRLLTGILIIETSDDSENRTVFHFTSF